jgi:hypothetical protein
VGRGKRSAATWGYGRRFVRREMSGFEGVNRGRVSALTDLEEEGMRRLLNNFVGTMMGRCERPRQRRIAKGQEECLEKFWEGTSDRRADQTGCDEVGGEIGRNYLQ